MVLVYTSRITGQTPENDESTELSHNGLGKKDSKDLDQPMFCLCLMMEFHPT